MALLVAELRRRRVLVAVLLVLAAVLVATWVGRLTRCQAEVARLGMIEAAAVQAGRDLDRSVRGTWAPGDLYQAARDDLERTCDAAPPWEWWR